MSKKDKLVPPLEGMVMQTVEHFDSYDAQSQRFETNNIAEAHVITSQMRKTFDEAGSYVNLHKPVLDIDFPAQLIPSSTPGHFHLYLDKEVPWDKYVALLEALMDCGILEDGYVGASIARGFTAARLPWISKYADAPVIQPRCVGCDRPAWQIPEYIHLAKEEKILDASGTPDADAAARREEGTYNRANGHFWCNACYIKAGMPLGVAP